MNISSGEIELWRSGETLEVPPELNLTISNIHGATSTNSYDLKMVLFFRCHPRSYEPTPHGGLRVVCVYSLAERPNAWQLVQRLRGIGDSRCIVFFFLLFRRLVCLGFYRQQEPAGKPDVRLSLKRQNQIARTVQA